MKIWQICIILWCVIASALSGTPCTQLKPGSFNCSGLSLTEVPQIDVSGIWSLDLSYNQIRQLSSADFVNYKSLQRLNVSHNSISVVSHDAFLPLVNLSVLDFSANNVSASVAYSLSVSLSQTLSSLNLAHNALQAIPSFSLPNLHDVSFAFNQIRFVYFGASWKVSTSLKSLSLSHNYISSMSSRDFDSLPNSVSEIDLSYCSLTKIDKTVLKKFKDSLELINIESNQFNDKSFKEIFSSAKWRALKDIRASRNKLSVKALSAFSAQSFTNLSSLKLAHNIIDSVKIASVLLELRFLDLSKNRIRDIENLSFVNCPKLEYLDVSGQTYPVNVYENAFKQLVYLKQLYLSNNGISFNQDNLKKILSQTKKLTLLDLSGNKIQQLFNDSLVALPSLVTLDLSHCNLERWDRLTFTSTVNLSSLDLSWNSIKTIKDPTQNTSLYSIANTLKFIDLMKNPFICNCDILWLKNWLIETHKAPNYRTYTCSYDDTVVPIISYNNETCGGPLTLVPPTSASTTSVRPTTTASTSTSTILPTTTITSTTTPGTTSSQQTTPKPTGYTTAIFPTSIEPPTEKGSSFPVWATVLISLVSLIAIASAVAFILIRRRKKTQNDESNIPFLTFRDGEINNSDNVPMIEFRRTMRRCFQSDPDYDLVL